MTPENPQAETTKNWRTRTRRSPVFLNYASTIVSLGSTREWGAYGPSMTLTLIPRVCASSTLMPVVASSKTSWPKSGPVAISAVINAACLFLVSLQISIISDIVFFPFCGWVGLVAGSLSELLAGGGGGFILLSFFSFSFLKIYLALGANFHSCAGQNLLFRKLYFKEPTPLRPEGLCLGHGRSNASPGADAKNARVL